MNPDETIALLDQVASHGDRRIAWLAVYSGGAAVDLIESCPDASMEKDDRRSAMLDEMVRDGGSPAGYLVMDGIDERLHLTTFPLTNELRGEPWVKWTLEVARREMAAAMVRQGMPVETSKEWHA